MLGFGGRQDGSVDAFRKLAEVRAYWQALREGTAPPRRDRLNPRGMAQALEHVFLAEEVAQGHARMRLAGMHLTDLLGMEVRGMPLSALFEPAARSRLGEALPAVLQGRSALDLRLEAERGIGRPALSARMLLLPLLDLDGRPGLALGCLCSDGGIGRAPRRFAIARLTHEALAPVASALTPALLAGRPPHLRLVSSRP